MLVESIIHSNLFYQVCSCSNVVLFIQLRVVLCWTNLIQEAQGWWRVIIDVKPFLLSFQTCFKFSINIYLFMRLQLIIDLWKLMMYWVDLFQRLHKVWDLILLWQNLETFIWLIIIKNQLFWLQVLRDKILVIFFIKAALKNVLGSVVIYLLQIHLL